MTENEVLRTQINGVDFFTIVATGDCAVSQIGLARLCGVERSAIRKILEPAKGHKRPRGLENLAENGLYLDARIVKRGQVLKAVKAAVAVEIILYYNRKGNAIAQATTDAILEVGLIPYIQSKTGWLPEKYTTGTQLRGILDRVSGDRTSDNSDPWERLYHPKLCKQAFTWFGVQFYWNFCYSWMTPEERSRVELVSPVIRGGREYRVYEYIDRESEERLKPEIAKLVLLLTSSTSKKQFESLYRNLYGREKYLDLF